MPHKPVKVIGPKQFHLRGHQSHYPTINLAGGGDRRKGQRIEFDDERKKKLAWARDYITASAKLGAEAYSWEQTPDTNRYWYDQVAREQFAQDLTRQLGRSPTEQEFAQAWPSVQAHYYRLISQDPETSRLVAGDLASAVDPRSVNLGQESDYNRRATMWNQLSDAQRAALVGQGVQAPRLNLAGVQTVDGQDQLNPGFFQTAQNAASGAKQQFVDNRIGDPVMRTPAAGPWGILEPIAEAAGPLVGQIGGVAASSMIPTAGSKTPVGPNGELTVTPTIGSNPMLESRARGLDDRARLVSDYNKAVANQDPETADRLVRKLREHQFADPAALAKRDVAGTNSNELTANLGSTVGGVYGSRLWNGARTLGGAARGPLASLPLSTVIPAVSEAVKAEPGHRLEAAGRAAQAVAPLALKNEILNGLARAAMPRGAMPAIQALESRAGGSAVGNALRWAGRRATQGLPNLIRAPGSALTAAGPSSRLAGAGNIGRNLLAARVMMQGGMAGMDLAQNAMNWNDSESPDKLQLEQAVGNQAIADDETGSGRRAVSNVTGGLQGVLGDLQAAKARFGANWGKVAPNTPAGRAVEKARRDLSSMRAQNAGQTQTGNALVGDDRFTDLDPNTSEALARLGAEHAGTAATLDYGRPVNDQIGTQFISQYARARQAAIEGRPMSPEDQAILSELSGAKPGPNGQLRLTPDQYQRAAQNAVLYHRLGPNNARQVLQGHLPGEIQDGQRAPQGANQVARAVGVAPGQPWQTHVATPNVPQPAQPTQAQPVAPQVIPPGPGKPVPGVMPAAKPPIGPRR